MTIFADYNAIADPDLVRLGFPAAEEQMRRAGVIANDWGWLSDGEVIVGARIRRDPRLGLVGQPDWKTLVHLDDEEASDFPRLWSKLQRSLRDPGRSAEQEADVFRLLTVFEEIAPPEVKAAVPPGYLPLRRAGALYSLGDLGLALHEVRAAIRERPDDPELVYCHLELLLRDDPDRAAREAGLEAEKGDVPAPVLAACIDIWSAAGAQASDDSFGPIADRIVRWASRFEVASGRGQVRASILAGVQFHLGLTLLRQGRTNQARDAFRLAQATDPNEASFAEAADLDAFDDSAIRIAARLRDRPLSWPRAA